MVFRGAGDGPTPHTPPALPHATVTLTVFGATGRTGQPLVEQALAQGHAVRAFVRSRHKLADQQDQAVVGR